jgi:hypothetical protein
VRVKKEEEEEEEGEEGEGGTVSRNASGESLTAEQQ